MQNYAIEAKEVMAAIRGIVRGFWEKDRGENSKTAIG
jgi:hypothetical protein